MEPEERPERLDSLKDPDSGTEAFCRTLYRERYTHSRDPRRKADNRLWRLVSLPGLYKRGPGKTALKRELEGAGKEPRLDPSTALGETEQSVLYLEFRDAARRYLSTIQKLQALLVA